jgi:GT2 family glycosyltransferase
MRLAFDKAFAQGYDFYLWLNDDTFLYEDAIARLLREYTTLKGEGVSKSIIVGATQDQETGSLTYGGVNRHSWWYPLKFVTVTPGETAKQCDTMHGNCVLIPHTVAAVLGNLDSNFAHHLSDFDYGFRASQKGFSVWLAPGFVGTCSYHEPLWRDKKLSLKEQIKAVNHIKGLRMSEWKLYAQRHAGPLWPIYWLSPYAKLVITSFFPRWNRS